VLVEKEPAANTREWESTEGDGGVRESFGDELVHYGRETDPDMRRSAFSGEILG